jgi:predicted alpha/beta superfamily hydrolase
MQQILLLIISAFVSLNALSQAKPMVNQNKPLIIGEIYEIQSSILSEKRTLNIYLPSGYNANDTTTYPVVYLLDGGTDEDFLHITGLYQFNGFPWVNYVEPSIIIGITNSDRKRDMTFPTMDTADQMRYPTSGHSDKFIGFLEKKLQPYVQKNFKTNKSKTIIGESLSGLLATEILIKKPYLFNKYIIVSPSLWWDNGSLLNQSSAIMENTFLQQTDIYIGVGKEGLTPGKIPRVMEVDANLLAERLTNAKKKKVKFYFDYLPHDNHGTIMHQAVLNALRLIRATGGEKN